ncbi:MAG: hypothetical protein V3R35_03940 [Woeseiaceae bacterium]
MCLMFSFIPATFWVVVGYFILFSSARAEGRVRTFGQVLAVWVFALAVLIPVAAAYVTFAGLCPIDALMHAAE